MNKALLDTDIFSEIIKGRHHKVKSKSNAYLLRFGNFIISALTVIEVVKGLQKKGKHDKITKLLSEIKNDGTEILPLTFAASVLAGEIIGSLEQQGKPIGFADPIIAAIAIDRNLPLVTGNIKHYERIQKLGYPLDLENWKE